jgi:hypothetical protein
LDALVAVLSSESDAARVSAANAILDRAYGKPSQSMTGEGGGAIVYEQIRRIIVRNDP